jgi:predicted RND superfamily exporter protein
MKTENTHVEQKDLNLEMEVNEKEIEISEKSDRLMKKSIAYLKVGFWTFAVWSVLILISTFVNFSKNAIAGIVVFIFVVLILGALLIKMYAYIGDYKKFKETKTQKALEDLLDAQKGYYGWIYFLPLIMFVVMLVIAALGTFLK